MNERDLLRPMRDQALPVVPAGLSARIHAAAREQLGRAVKRRRSGSAWATAAVLFLCVSHLVWTVAFLERVQAKTAANGLLRP
jgi:hypothetical protein